MSSPDPLQITFARLGKTLPWDPACYSLLELAENAGIDAPSGCRYGDCATCQTRLLKGEVTYIHDTSATPDPNTCLPCSCRPQTDVTLDL